MKSESPELYIPIRDIPATVARMTGNRTKPSRSVVYRWLRSGNRGVKLKRCWIGSIQHTKESWLREFLDATATSDTPGANSGIRPSAPSRRGRLNDTRRVQRAQRQLSQMGI